MLTELPDQLTNHHPNDGLTGGGGEERIRVDATGQISFRLPTAAATAYQLAVQPDGVLVLRPIASAPRREVAPPVVDHGIRSPAPGTPASGAAVSAPVSPSFTACPSALASTDAVSSGIDAWVQQNKEARALFRQRSGRRDAVSGLPSR